MATYVLEVLDQAGAAQQIPLASVLGYAHVQVDDALGAPVDLANVPAEDPPVGYFPAYDEDLDELLLPFTVTDDATGDGPVVALRAYLATTTTEEWDMVQLGDHARPVFTLYDGDGLADVSNPSLIEVHARRADGSTLILPNAACGLVTDGRDGEVFGQYGAGQVQSVGRWRIQARVVLSDGRELRSEVRNMIVEGNA